MADSDGDHGDSELRAALSWAAETNANALAPNVVLDGGDEVYDQ
jgi:hypothetical protein